MNSVNGLKSCHRLSLSSFLRHFPRLNSLQGCYFVSLVCRRSSIASLATGLVYSLFAVATVAALTIPSAPGKTLLIMPLFQSPLGAFGSMMNTRSPTSTFFTFSNHLHLLVNSGRHSFDHLIIYCFLFIFSPLNYSQNRVNNHTKEWINSSFHLLFFSTSSL